jgi:hypothetical protein
MWKNNLLYKICIAISLLQFFNSCEKKDNEFYLTANTFIMVEGPFATKYSYEVNKEGYVVRANRLYDGDNIAESYQYYYDKNTGILNRIIHRDYNGDIISNKKYNNTYDQFGNLVKSDNIYYTYNNGNLAEIISGSPGDLENSWSHKSFYYNDFGDLFIEIDSIFDSRLDVIDVYKYFYNFNQDGNLESIIGYINNNIKPSDSLYFTFVNNKLQTVKRYFFSEQYGTYLKDCDSMIYDSQGRYLRLYNPLGYFESEKLEVEFDYPSDFTVKPIVRPNFDYEPYILKIPKSGFSLWTLYPSWE